MKSKNGSNSCVSSVGAKGAREEIKGPRKYYPIKKYYDEEEEEEEEEEEVSEKEQEVDDYNDKGWNSSEDENVIKQFEDLNIKTAEPVDKDLEDQDDINTDEVVAKGPKRVKDAVKESARSIAAPYARYSSFSGGGILSLNTVNEVSNNLAPNLLPESVEQYNNTEPNREISEYLQESNITLEEIDKILTICQADLSLQRIDDSNNSLSPDHGLGSSPCGATYLDPSYAHDNVYIPNIYTPIVQESNPPCHVFNIERHLKANLQSVEQTYNVDRNIASPESEKTFTQLKSPQGLSTAQSGVAEEITTWTPNLISNTNEYYSNNFSPSDSGISMSPDPTCSPHPSVSDFSESNDNNYMPNIPLQPEMEQPCKIIEATPLKTKPHVYFPSSSTSSPEQQSYSNIKITTKQGQMKTFTVLSNVKERSILPTGVEVSEVDLHKPGADRLKNMCNNWQKEIAWKMICLEKEEEIVKLNSKQQTKLMQILHENPGKQFLERIFTRVKRMLKENRKELLTHRDMDGKTALYYSTVLHRQYPVLSRFIAEVYTELNQNPEELFGVEDNTLIHIIAGLGDDYAQILAELLRVEYPNKRKAFDVNKMNKSSLTPLHIAAKTHSANLKTTAITKLLVKSDAQIRLQNNDGKTPLHLAVEGSCDPLYIKALLQSVHHSSTYINTTDKDGNTAMHICCSRTDISYKEQSDVIKQLTTSGASNNIRNNGKRPLSLLPLERKDELKSILNGK